MHFRLGRIPFLFYQYCLTVSLDSRSDKWNLSAIRFIVSARDASKSLYVFIAPLSSLSSRICCCRSMPWNFKASFTMDCKQYHTYPHPLQELALL